MTLRPLTPHWHVEADSLFKPGFHHVTTADTRPAAMEAAHRHLSKLVGTSTHGGIGETETVVVTGFVPASCQLTYCDLLGCTVRRQELDREN